MPIVEPKNQGGHFLREKILLIGGAGSGKTTSYLNIAWWSHQSGGTARFFVVDTDDESVLQVMNEPRYAGMLAEEGGNVHVFRVNLWEDYEDACAKILAEARESDWVCLDFINHFWQAVQEGYLRDQAKKTKSQMIRDATEKGLSGWDAYREINYQFCNASYFETVKPLLIQSRAHVFMVGEEEEIQERGKMTPEQKEHIATFGHWRVSGGQKKLPFQCRSFLRVQRLARGRVLFTLKDRARTEYNGDVVAPDFFSFYLKNAGWTITDPE